MTEREDAPDRFPEGGKRVIFYLFYDHDGIVDDYIPYKLERLRPFAEHIFVIVNGHITDEGRARLEAVSDTVWQRRNVGFDVWGYKEGLAEFGEERLAEYDELILMNYTWFGPVNPFDPVFERMDPLDVDFWGMTVHGEIDPNPFTLKGVLPAHLQSHWLAVRPRMFRSREWSEYWASIPPIRSYTESILAHESRFTKRFADLGFRFASAFPPDDYDTTHPALFEADRLLLDGCPVLKRRPFFHDPLFLDLNAVVPRRYAEIATTAGYPLDLVWQNITRGAKPKVMNTNGGMLEVMPETAVGYDPDRPLRIAVVLHLFYLDLVDELLDHVTRLPGRFDLVMTTTDEEKAADIQQILDRRGDPAIARSEIRVLPSNRGRDLSAFFIECSDIIRSDEYDLVFKVHSKKTVQEMRNAGELFRRQQLGNLFGSPGYAANLVGLFQREPLLGMAYAPTVHMGFPTLGRGWFGNEGAAAEMAEELGIHVPLDDPSPLAPYGCMFAFRPAALRLMTDREWTYEEYAPPTEHKDGSLAHVQERLFSYAVAQLGYYTKTVATTRYAAISHTSLEYKLDRMSRNIPGYAFEQVEMLDRGGFLGGGPLGFLKVYLRLRHPGVARALRRPYSVVRAPFRLYRHVRHRSRLAASRRERAVKDVL